MTKDALAQFIQVKKPRIIYLTGKTSTGKSTFAAQIQKDLGYAILSLDEVVKEAVILPEKLSDQGNVFIEVYRNRSKSEWLKAFVGAAQKNLAALVGQGQLVLLEGALANPETIKELFEQYPDFAFVYFHPTDKKEYQKNLESRFVQTTEEDRGGLPQSFWSLVDECAFQQFCQDAVLTPYLKTTLETYAEQSIKESETRLAGLKSVFPQIIRVEV